MVIDNILRPLFPLKFIGITSGFKTPSRPGHIGVDFGWNRKHGGPNHDLIAVCDAKIIEVKNDIKDGTGTSYGNYILMQSTYDKKYSFMYGHLLKGSIKVKKGDIVKSGEVIAKMGNSGKSTGTHLHFEVRINNTRHNPLDHIYLVGNEYVTGESKTKYKLLVMLKPTPEPEPSEFKIGDKVTVKAGTVYSRDSYGKSFGITQENDYDTSIALRADLSRPYPYNVYGNSKQYLGWVKATDIIKKN